MNVPLLGPTIMTDGFFLLHVVGIYEALWSSSGMSSQSRKQRDEFTLYE